MAVNTQQRTEPKFSELLVAKPRGNVNGLSTFTYAQVEKELAARCGKPFLGDLCGLCSSCENIPFTNGYDGNRGTYYLNSGTYK